MIRPSARVTRPSAPTTWLMSCNTVLYHDRGGLRHGRPRSYDTARQRSRARGDKTGRCLRYGRRGCNTACPCVQHSAQKAPYDTAPMRHDTAGARLRHCHDTAGEGATIRPNARHDTALCSWPVRSLGQGWVHCALDSVLTQCTILSHCLGHCS